MGLLLPYQEGVALGSVLCIYSNRRGNPGEYHLMIDNPGATITGIIPMPLIVAFDTCCDATPNKWHHLYDEWIHDMFVAGHAKS